MKGKKMTLPDENTTLPLAVGILMYKLKIAGFKKKRIGHVHNLFSVSPPLGRLVVLLATTTSGIDYMVLVPYKDRDEDINI